MVMLTPKLNEKPGALIAIEKDTIGIDIKRVFYIYGLNGETNIRGNHGHTHASEFIVCLNGSVEINTTYTNGVTSRFLLTSPNVGLMIPPLNHIILKLSRKAVLMVICDTEFKDDIIR